MTTFEDWMAVGREREWVGPIWCYVHDAPPLTDDEEAVVNDNDGDLDAICIPSVRLFPFGLASAHARTEGDDMTDTTSTTERDLVTELEECIGELPAEVADLFNSALNGDIELSNAGLRAWLDDFLAEQDDPR